MLNQMPNTRTADHHAGRSPRSPSICAITCRLTPILLLMLTGITLSGCGSWSWSRSEPVPEPCRLPRAPYYESILDASYAAADRLAEMLAARGISVVDPFVPASFVNIDDLSQTCTLGRMVPDQIASRLSVHGVRFIELKLRQQSLYIRQNEGEFALSRELMEISRDQEIFAILLGTYAVSESSVFVSVRIVLTEDSSVVAGLDYELDRGLVPDAFLK